MTAKGNNQFVYWQTDLMLGGMVVTIFTQIHWLAQGLKHFDAVYCIPIFQGKVIQSEGERASRIWKHCSYRHSDFLLVGSSFNALYGVTAFKQAQTVYTKKSNS